MRSSNGQQRFRIQGTSTTTRFTPNNSNDAFTFVGSVIYTSGAFDIPSARLHIKGNGATSATTSLLVQNSAGDDMFKVADDGSTYIGSYKYFGYNNNNSIRFATGEYIQNMQGSTSSNKWSLRDSSTAYGFLQAFSKSRKVAINLNASNADTDVDAQLHVKGAGATSATTALLVQNSAGADLLKVQDDGKIYFNGVNLVVQGKQIYNGATSNGFMKFNANRLEYSDSATSGLDNSAALTITSTTKGFLPPRMTGEQRDAIESPASGLIIYNTTTNKAQCYNGSDWNDMF